jgi:hypothetical protein
MFNLMSFKLQMKFVSEYSGQGDEAEWPSAKGQYPSLEEVASKIFFCYAPPRRKNHNGIKRIAAPILPLARPIAAGWGCDPLRTARSRHSDQSATI